MIKEVKPRNIFTLPSVLLSIIASVYVNFHPLMLRYFDTGEFRERSIPKALYSTFAMIGAAAFARYNDDKDEPIYTPRLLPGHNRQDFVKQEQMESGRYIDNGDDYVM